MEDSRSARTKLKY